MEIDPTRVCELLVGLPDVDVVGVEDVAGGSLMVHVRCRDLDRWCRQCGSWAKLKDRRLRELVDLPVFGRRARLVWHQHRWVCPQAACPSGSWTQTDTRIAWPRMALTDRAGRWACEQVGRFARSVNEVAIELGCDWHTINDAVIAYGTALVGDRQRFGQVEAIGLDEVLFVRTGPYRRQDFSTQIVDVGKGQLLDVVPGRSGKAPSAWLASH